MINTDKKYQTFLSAFETFAHKHPDHIALQEGATEISYRELNCCANAVAQEITDLGIVSQQPVAVLYPMSAKAIVALLGILKCDCVYVPIAPESKISWQLAVIEIHNIELLMGEPEHTQSFNSQHGLDVLFHKSPFFSNNVAKDEDLMYIMHTSGSTGSPKSVSISHASVNRLFPVLEPVLCLSSQERWSASHQLTFGFSIWEIWGALAYGGTLIIAQPKDLQTPLSQAQFIYRENISIFSRTPSEFHYLCQGLGTFSDSSRLLRHLKWVHLSGESMSRSTADPWFEHFKENAPKLLNLYALTETAGPVFYHVIDPHRVEHENTLGTPLSDVQIELKNGELYVSGACVKHSQRKDPYPTGDLVQLLPNGEYIFMGRKDSQVKIRGHRVSLYAIENLLLKHPKVNAVKVIQQGQSLIAYVHCESTVYVENEVKTWLKLQNLPAHHIPEKIHICIQWPLTSHGKLDVKAFDEKREISLKEKLRCIWMQVLGQKHIQDSSDFFELGGYSLLTLTLINQIQSQCGIQLHMKDIFKYPTFDKLSLFLLRQKQQKKKPYLQEKHAFFMSQLLKKAREAAEKGIPPYAAGVLLNGEWVSLVYNQVNIKAQITAHAEMEAIQGACKALQTVDLSDCILYSSVEPCSMCLSACFWANIPIVVYSLDMKYESRYGLSERISIPSKILNQQLSEPMTLISDCLQEDMHLLCENWLEQRAFT